MTARAFILAALATAVGSLIAFAVTAANAKAKNPLARLLLP